MTNKTHKLLVQIFLATLFCTSYCQAEDQANSSFLPTWRLLNTEQKRQFIAGYLQGWSDARVMTSIALDYVRTNPAHAVEGLERMQKIYDLTALTSENLVKSIDSFYADPDNKDASLSLAVSAAQTKTE